MWATRHISRGTDPRWMAKQMGTSLKMIFETYTVQWDRARDRKSQVPARRDYVYKVK